MVAGAGKAVTGVLSRASASHLLLLCVHAWSASACSCWSAALSAASSSCPSSKQSARSTMLSMPSRSRQRGACTPSVDLSRLLRMRAKEDPSGTAAAWLDPREGSGNPTGRRPDALPDRETAGAPAARPSKTATPRSSKRVRVLADGRGLAGRIGGYWACPVASRGPRSALREDEEHVMPPSPRSVRVPGPGLLPSPRSVRVPVPGMDRAAALATGGPAPASGGEVVDDVRDAEVADEAKPTPP